MMSTHITINGVEYDGPEAMPPSVREQYDRIMGLLPDKDANGIADFLERVPPTTHVVHRTVKDLSELSDDERAMVERALADQARGSGTTEHGPITTSREKHVSITTSSWPSDTTAGGSPRSRSLAILFLALLGLLFVLLAT